MYINYGFEYRRLGSDRLFFPFSISFVRAWNKVWQLSLFLLSLFLFLFLFSLSTCSLLENHDVLGCRADACVLSSSHLSLSPISFLSDSLARPLALQDTEGGRWWWWRGGQWPQHGPQRAVGVCGGDQWCPTPTCQAGNFSRAGYCGGGTKWTVWGLSSDYMGAYIQLGHGLCVGLNSVTKRSVREWHNAQSRWRAAQQGHSIMFHDLLANGTTLSYPRTPLGIRDPHKGTLSSRLGLSCIYPCRG